MVLADKLGHRGIVHRHLQARGDRAYGFDAALLMHDVTRQDVRRRQCLAQVVCQRTPTHQGITRGEPRGSVEHELDVDTGVHLGMELRSLRHPVERVHFRKQHA